MRSFRVLVLHSHYLSGPLSGENRVVETEAELLREAGHEVEVVALSPNALTRRTLAARTLTSRGVAGWLGERVRAESVDVVHAHNLYPAVGPGALSAASGAGAAVVMTLHNYRLMCLAGTFRRNGHPCEVCLGHTPWRAVVHACYRGSRAQSALVATSLTAHRARGVFDLVGRYLAVSEFVRHKHIEAGFPAEKIVVKPNVVPRVVRREGAGEYFLVLGRLSSEKGVLELVRAWSPDFGELRVVGDGPLRAEVAEAANTRGVILGEAVHPDNVPAVLAGARAVLLPSLSYEGQPRVVLEAYAAGVPVVAHDVGALGEIVDESTGALVPVGDWRAWEEAARRLANDDVSRRMGECASRRWEERFSPEHGLRALEDAYACALAERG